MEVLSVREQYQVMEESLRERLDQLVPQAMREHEVDLWVVACREYNEDPVFRALFPPAYPTARRLTMVAFAADGRRWSLSMPDEGLEPYYTQYWRVREEDQMSALNRLCAELEPTTIALNVSKTTSFADGMTTGVFHMMQEGVSEQWVKRMRSVDDLVVDVMGRRTPTERRVYPHVLDAAFSVIDAMYTPEVVKPGVTTCADLEWFMRQRVRDMGLGYWFEPTMDLQRRGTGESRSYGTIEAGDLIHCDFGIRYLGVCTDTQRLAYVALPGEDGLPDDYARGMKTNNRFQDIVRENMVPGRTGNEVFTSSIGQAKAEGIQAMLYSHPCNLYGHGPGPTIGLYSNQAEIPVQGDFKLACNTTFALELNTTSKSANGEETVFYTEETVYLDEDGVRFLHPGRETITVIH
ncbi:M24 family metallopeptidase [Collinsella sp. An2]|uniref:M24 family metallopeptidase n=1 Tax=Collinsella sp. An2 TaxID=1965585 RepID=UPI00195214B7|nr:M24 family metallopeptidase [Collinsella sp. An2]